jgi:hypothetical protein
MTDDNSSRPQSGQDCAQAGAAPSNRISPGQKRNRTLRERFIAHLAEFIEIRGYCDAQISISRAHSRPQAGEENLERGGIIAARWGTKPGSRNSPQSRSLPAPPFDFDGLACRSQVGPPHVVPIIVPASPTIHPVSVFGRKNTLLTFARHPRQAHEPIELNRAGTTTPCCSSPACAYRKRRASRKAATGLGWRTVHGASAVLGFPVLYNRLFVRVRCDQISVGNSA